MKTTAQDDAAWTKPEQPNPEIRVAVILPAHNEEGTIARTIIEFARAIPDARICVVDNNSSDRTTPVARETLAEHCRRGVVIHETVKGKGNAVRRAFREIDVDVYVLADADATYPAHQIRELIQPILDGHADMVVGDRHSGGDYARENTRRLHGAGNRLIQALVNILFHARLTDIMSGYRAMSRAFVKNYPILVEGFSIETDMTLHALDKRFRVWEVPIAYKNRPEGSHSKLNTFKDGLIVLFTIAQIVRYYKPLPFFSGLALLIASASALAGLPVLNDWVTKRFIEHVPLAILASGLGLIAVICVAIGLVLDSITNHQRREFERSLLSQYDSNQSRAS